MAPARGKLPPHQTRSALWPVIRFGLCILLLSLVFSLLALPWFNLSWWRIFRRCVSIAAIFGLWISIRVVERRSIRSYGFLRSGSGEGRRQFAFGVCLGLTVLVWMLAIGLALGVCGIQVTPDTVRLWRTLIGFLPAAVLIGVLEELVFRGDIFQHLLAASRSFAVILSSALYALVHVKTAQLGLAVGMELGGLFLLGVVLALSYMQTRQLYLAVGLHAALAYGARVNKLLLNIDTAHIWLVGTSRLVNGLAGWIALAAIGCAVTWWVRSSPQGGWHDERA